MNEWIIYLISDLIIYWNASDLMLHMEVRPERVWLFPLLIRLYGCNAIKCDEKYSNIAFWHATQLRVEKKLLVVKVLLQLKNEPDCVI